MKLIFFIIVNTLFFVANAERTTKIDYIGQTSHEYHFDINTFYRIWYRENPESFTVITHNEKNIDEINKFLRVKEITNEKYTWPMAIIYSDGPYMEGGIYEVGLMNMRKVGNQKVYKTPIELWLLLNDLLRKESIFDFYKKEAYKRNIVGEGGYHYMY